MATQNLKPFDGQLDDVQASLKPFDGTLDGEAPAAPGLIRGTADSALALGSGLATGVKMVSDAFGANNTVSKAAGGAATALSDLVSPYRKAEKQERSRLIKQADDSGSTWEEVKAYAGAFGEAPLDTTLEALGTSAPTLALGLIPGVGQARLAQIGMGAIQGAGSAKGQIYESVEQKHREAGATPEQAAALAAQAQEYTGANAGNIGISAGIGGLAGSTGAEGAIARLAGRKVGQEAAKQGLIKSEGLGVAKEAPMEALQGGQERYTSNVALQREGFDVPTWQGVAGNAALEGIAAAPMGGGFGALEAMSDRQTAPQQDPVPIQPEQPDAVTPVAPTQVGSPLTDTGAGMLGAATDPLRSVVKPSEAMGIDPSAGAISKVAAMAVDTGVTQQAQAEQMAAQVQDAVINGEMAQPVADQADPFANVAATPPPAQPAPVSMESRSLDELRQGLRNAQDPAIRKTIAAEIRKRREAMPDPLTQVTPQQKEVTANGTQADQAQQSSTEQPKTQAADSGESGADVPSGIGSTTEYTAKLKDASNARRATDGLRGATGASTGAGTDNTDSGMGSAVGVESRAGRTDDTATAQPDARGADSGGDAIATKGADALNSATKKAPNKAQKDEPAKATPQAKERGEVRGDDAPAGKAATTSNSVVSAQDGGAGRPDNWRGNAIKAGKVARSLGLDPKGKRLKAIVAEIDAKDGASVVAKPASREQAIRDAWSKEPRTIGKWTPMTVDADGQKSDMLVNQKRAGGSKGAGALHVVNIRMGKMLKDMDREPIAYTFRLTSDNQLVEEGIPTVATPGQIAAWKGAGFALDDKKTNVQNTPQGTAGKAAPVEAAAPNGGDAAKAAGVPDAGEQAGVRADGVKPAAPKPDTPERAQKSAESEQVAKPEQDGGDAFMGVEAKPAKQRKGKITAEQYEANLSSWGNGAPKVMSDKADDYGFKSGKAVLLEAFHGTGRGDRVGTKFLKKRATSGPMSFFTSSPDLAGGYATGKQDTSLYNEDSDYVNWFKYQPKRQRSPVPLDRAWYALDAETKQRILDRMPDIRTDDDGNIIYEEGGGDIGSYQWNLKQTQRGYDKRGNPLAAAVETWLMSGSLFNEEQDFMKVLKLAGFPVSDISYDNPGESFPFVYKTWVRMSKPLVTSQIPADVDAALKEAAAKDRSRAASNGVDSWDKNTRTLKDWVKEYTEPSTGDNKFVWTSIPDKVTEVFQSMGYDGIIDWSGKGGGATHPVYIPFGQNQVKSAIGNSGKFDPAKDDITAFGTKPQQSQGTPADRAVMAMAGDGKSADEILNFIASASKSPYRRMLAKKLIASGANPAVSIGGEMGGGEGFRFLAKYSRKDYEVTLSEGASDRAEQIFLHETVHAATMMALDKGGLMATQMKRLAASVYENASTEMRSMYGLVLDKRTGEVNVGEFVAEAFTNPEFQKALKGIKVPGGTVWERFVNMVRRVLGLADTQQDALSKALELGAEVMRENTAMRKAKSFMAEDGPAYMRTDDTQAAFDARIDELFSGAPANRVGPRILDRSDVMSMLGYEDKPVVLAESKVIQGMENHPEMTADVWKKIPEWLENPAAIFDSDTDGGLVVIAPELVGGNAVSIIVRPDGERRDALNVHLLLNAYSRSPSTPYQRWISQGLLRYADKKKFPALFEAVAGRQLPGTALQNKPGTKRILTDKNLSGWRKANQEDEANFGVASNAWSGPDESKFDDFIYKAQDKLIDLKRITESIKKVTGNIADDLNAYLQEELFHGRAAKKVEDFGKLELEPLMKAIAEKSLTLGDVEEYLHARHAPEANKLIAKRNPTEPNLQDGGSGMTTAAAQSYMAALTPADKLKLEAIAKRVDAIIEKSRNEFVEYGLEDQAVVDGWGKMFNHYIPLQREDKNGGMGIGQGFSVKGKETKGRTGSTRKVVDILANIALQRERLIVRGEKNKVAQALIGLARANPNDDFWEVRSQPPTERVYDAKTDSVVDRPDMIFKNRPNVLTAKVKDYKGNVTEQAVVFNEDDPRALRLATAMKNLDAGSLEGLLGVSAKITRYFSAINTQYNPVFGVVNLVRDVQGAIINLGETPLASKRARIAKDTMKALAGIYSDQRKTRKGGQANSQWSALWEEFQDIGGKTGYRELFRTSKDRADKLQNILTPDGWMDSGLGKVFTANGTLRVPMSVAKKKADWLFDWLSDYNEAMENGVRLSAYKAGRDQGMSKEQSASLARNLTVNFNRKGNIGMQAGALYAFFNAAMQGSTKIGQTLFTMEGGNFKTLKLSKTGKTVIYGGIMLGAAQALALAAAGFDDEDPPKFARERGLIIPTGGKTYIAIPMPLGYHVIPGIGRNIAEFALSGFEKPAHRLTDMVSMFADAFNPIGNSGLSMQTIAPTVLDPFVALSENRDWTGKAIARTSMNKAIPGHALRKDTASTLSKFLAETINTATGGNEYVAGAFSPTPDQIDYLIGQVTGGVGREFSKVEQTALSTIQGEDLPTYKIPLVGRFVGNAKGQSSEGSAFYANTERLNELETEMKGLRADGRGEEAMAIRQAHPEASLILMANATERRVQKLRKTKRELVSSGAPRDEVKAIEDRITEEMARLNMAMKRFDE